MCDGSGGFTVAGGPGALVSQGSKGVASSRDDSENHAPSGCHAPIRGLVKEDETAEDPTKQKVEQELEVIETMFVQTAGEAAVEGHASRWMMCRDRHSISPTGPNE